MNYNLLMRNFSLISVTCIIVITGAFVTWIFDPKAVTENGLIETGQNAFLALACLSHGYHCRNTPDSLDKYLRFGLALFCCGILLREFDLDKIGSAAIWKPIETLIRASVAVIFLVYLALMLKRFELLRSNIGTILYCPMILLTLLSCFIYLSGWPFDKELFPIPTSVSVLIEETLELNATVLLFLSSLNSEAIEAEPSVQM